MVSWSLATHEAEHGIMLAELDAEALLERGADPTVAVRQMRVDAQQLLRRAPAASR